LTGPDIVVGTFFLMKEVSVPLLQGSLENFYEIPGT